MNPHPAAPALGTPLFRTLQCVSLAVLCALFCSCDSGTPDPGGGGTGGGGGGTVGGVVVASILVTPSTATVEVGRTLQLSASVRDGAGNVISRTVTWGSGASGTATVDRATGLVTGVSVGTAEVTATADGFTARHTVTVGQKPVATVTLDPADAQVYTGNGGINYVATARAADGEVLNRGEFSWTASNPALLLGGHAILSGPYRATALVFGVAGGTTTITATLEGVRGTATLRVLVPTRLTLTPAGPGGGTLSADPQRDGYTHDTIVRVTPNPDFYSYFANWGSACTGTTVPCQLTMSSDRTVTGTFNAQPWMGTWGSTLTAVRTYSNGSCTWPTTFSPSSSVVVTYPRDNTTNTRSVSVRVLTRVSAPRGQGSVPSLTCNPFDGTVEGTFTGVPGTDGSFVVEGRLGGTFVVTVRGSPTAARTLPGTVSLRYSPTSDPGSGSGTGSFTAQPTLQAPPTP